MKGALPEDTKIIYQAVQNVEKLDGMTDEDLAEDGFDDEFGDA